LLALLCLFGMTSNALYLCAQQIGLTATSITSQGDLPSKSEISKLYDEMNLQQATQSYLWALPLVSFAQWQHEHEHVFGANSGDLVVYKSYEDKLGILTANATTPYIITFINLSKMGPTVLEMPPGDIAGGLGDFWQREMGVIGDWVQTVPGRHWFAYVRFYGPTEQYFDKSWKTDDIKLAPGSLILPAGNT
jgi:hypothetical protein